MIPKLHLSDLYNYQKQAVRDLIPILTSMQSLMVWLDLGLGKSIISLTIFKLMKQMNLAKTMVVVAPKFVVLDTWPKEIAKWSHLNDLKYSLMVGAARKRQNALFTKADVYLVNYESLEWLMLQIEHYWIKKGKTPPFDLVVFDEVTKMKRHEAKRFDAFGKFGNMFKYRMGLTASPAANREKDLWAQYYTLDSGKILGTSFDAFMQRFFRKESGAYGKWIPLEQSMDTIISMVEPITYISEPSSESRTPGVRYNDIFIKLKPKLMKEYKQLEEQFWLELDEDTILDVENTASLFSKLIQYADGVVYNFVDEEKIERTSHIMHREKFDTFDMLVEGSGDEPMLVSYNFISEQEEILKRHPEAKCLTGAKDDEVAQMLSDFNAGKLKILLAHKKSASHGLNLQYACRIVVEFGQTPDLELTEQFVGRVDRNGQKRVVDVYRILAKDTIDEKLIEMLEEKSEIQQDIINRMTKLKKEMYS